jgi:hypothetical protein
MHCSSFIFITAWGIPEKKEKQVNIVFRVHLGLFPWWGRHGHDRMVVGFPTTSVISTYHH